LTGSEYKMWSGSSSLLEVHNKIRGKMEHNMQTFSITVTSHWLRSI